MLFKLAVQIVTKNSKHISASDCSQELISIKRKMERNAEIYGESTNPIYLLTNIFVISS